MAYMTDGSANYQVRIADGWVKGSATYANMEPHHGVGMVYATMHHAPTEQALTRALDTDTPGARVAGVWLRYYFNPEHPDEGEWFLVRGNNGIEQEIKIPKSKVYIYSFDGPEYESDNDEYPLFLEDFGAVVGNE